MDLIQLKVPPDVLVMVADAIQRDIDQRPVDDTTPSLEHFHTWLRYRLSLWNNRRQSTDKP